MSWTSSLSICHLLQCESTMSWQVSLKVLFFFLFCLNFIHTCSICMKQTMYHYELVSSKVPSVSKRRPGRFHFILIVDLSFLTKMREWHMAWSYVEQAAANSSPIFSQCFYSQVSQEGGWLPTMARRQTLCSKSALVLIQVSLPWSCHTNCTYRDLVCVVGPSLGVSTLFLLRCKEKNMLK